MANIFNDDFRDFIEALHHQQVCYILVGGYSVILHGYSRTTGDMDIWVEKTHDIITAIKGLEFSTAYDQAKDVEVEGLIIRLIYYNDLLTAKRAAGRPRDINDLDNLLNQQV